MTAIVVVWLPVKFTVPYRIEVEDINDYDEIRKKLQEKDASDWLYDPNLYENLGSEFRHFVEKMTDEEITDNLEQMNDIHQVS